MRVCTSSEMRELDRIAESEYHIDSQLLMENAGRAAVQVLFDEYPLAGKTTEILILAGKGNNAGDAFVVARRLICLDRRVRVFLLVDPSHYSGATAKNYEILKQMNAKMMVLETAGVLEEFFKSSHGPFTVIDGVLGTGLKGPLEGIFADVIEMINELKISEVVSLDIPSGINGDTGEIPSVSMRASLTVSFGFPKLGHFLPPGAGQRGTLVNVDISLPPRFRKEGDKYLLRSGPMAHLLKERDQYGHKNSFGHSVLVGGSRGMLGAILMAARACQKMGTGLTTVATWEECMDALMIKLPDETMAVPVKWEGPEAEDYKEGLQRFSSMVLGPGLGLGKRSNAVIQQILLYYSGPLVIDADALKIIGDQELHKNLFDRPAPTVLTPHPGEMARLLKCQKEKVIEDPIWAIQKAVEMTNSIVVLKGGTTLIGSGEEVIDLNHYPNDGMATAGTGDVLAGIIGGLLGQKMGALEAARLGVYLHSLAGDLAAQAQGHRSMTAFDIIENIGNAFKNLKETQEPSFPEEGRARLR